MTQCIGITRTIPLSYYKDLIVISLCDIVHQHTQTIPFYPALSCMSRGLCDRAGVHIYICFLKIESYFSDRLTFSNIRSRTSCQIYRLALPLRAPETLSSLNKSRISIFNAHLALFVRRMTSHNSIGRYSHISKLTLELTLNQTISRIIAELGKK